MDSATSVVADAALSALFQRLLDTLALPFLKRLGFLFGVEKEAKKLKSTLLRIEALLRDAEERQIKEESVRLWLSDLKQVAYDAEDILDELEYMALRSKIEAAPIQTRKRKLTDQVPHFFSRLGSNFNLGSRIKEIRERLDEIVTENNHLHLQVIHHGPETERLRMRPPTGSFVDESIVFGREADKSEVVRLLTSDDSSIHEVVCICGMGGLGKTTLAQLAYNDERVAKHFVVKVWVYVSEDFDLSKLTKAIAESVPGSNPHLTNLDAIQVSIKEALKEKKFLLVLDDVWTEDLDDWHKLRAPLMFGARGSRILVTTRSRRVSSNIGTVPTHFLQGLSDDDCWFLFEKRAFVDGDSDAHPDLVKIGKEIVNKCKGLPLAVKTLGGLLRSVVDVVQWEAILKNEIWELPEERNDILPALRLSYHHLPAHLKRCFAYCACLINKGCYGEVEGNELILKWMALGFIQPKGSASEQMEDVGREYLDDLVSRSLLNCSRVVNSQCYAMHDLTHDLACSVLGTDFWKIGDEKSHGNNAEKARYMSLRYITSCSNYEDFYCLKSLRTLSLSDYENIPVPAALFINLRHIRTLHLYGSGITELPESIGDLLQLRYLELSGCNIERLPKSTTRLYNLQTLILDECEELVEVPESIGNLKQLRYLNLSWTKIERLPKSTTRLYNLQTLILDGCRKLVELPSDLSNLVNLRHLRCRVDGGQVSIPPRIGTLKGLQTLGYFNVGKEIGRGINELKDLIHLTGSLCISELENVVDVEEAKEAQLKNKRKIDALELRWKCDGVELQQDGIKEEVLNALQPHTNLKVLEIKGYCGVRFPTWLGDSSFSRLISVCLSKCKCRLLPPFGRLPSLKYLSLEDFSNITSLPIGLQHLTSLEYLRIFNCPELTSLYDVDLPATLDDGLGNSNYSNPTCLPKGLQKLRLLNCPKIPSLPEELLTTLQSLEITKCRLLVEKYLVLAEGGNGYRYH